MMIMGIVGDGEPERDVIADTDNRGTEPETKSLPAPYLRQNLSRIARRCHARLAKMVEHAGQQPNPLTLNKPRGSTPDDPAS